MRTADEIRDGLIDVAQAVVSRPSMSSDSGRDLEIMVRNLLTLALYADGRDDEGGASDHLGRYGKSGVTGPFRSLLGAESSFLYEAAIVMAHQLLERLRPAPPIRLDLRRAVRGDPRLGHVHETGDLGLRLDPEPRLAGD